MHSHSHGHHGHHQSSDERLGWVFLLNVSFTIIEFIGGWLTNSTAIMADAVHDLGDSLAIGLAWILGHFSDKSPSKAYSYGYKRLSLFGALVNSIILIIGAVFVLSEAIPRLFEPQMPVVEGMFALAVLGVAVNGFAVYKLKAGSTMNEKVLTWHLLEDALGWLVVLVVSVVLMFVDWPILDPILSIGFTLFILFNVLKSLKSTTGLFLQGTPDADTQRKIREVLSNKPQIDGVHHLHFWSLDGESHVLTAHLTLNAVYDVETIKELKAAIADELARFHLAHTTIEIEFPDEQCRDKSD
ncbi:MAG: cation transporter [Gammaproteobacteria bacterium]|nr:cation transporter [Gammaproteobacteria bacterium]